MKRNMMLVKWLSGLVLTLMMQLALAGEKIDRTLDVTASGQVEIESLRGSLKIYGWDKPQMQVKGELDDKAKGYEFVHEDGFTFFKVKMPRKMRNSNWKSGRGSKLEIYLPVGSRLAVETVNSDVLVEAVEGGSKVHTVNGNIKAKNLAKRIELETVNGSIKSEGLSGKFRLNTVNGRIKDKNSEGKAHFEIVNGSIDTNTKAKEVVVENVNGNIELKLTQVKELEISTVNGDVEAELTLLDDAEVNVTTVSGSASLQLGGAIGGDYELDSHAGGRIVNRLTDDEVKKQKYGPARSARFSIAGGTAEIEMTSVSGDLIIEGQ